MLLGTFVKAVQTALDVGLSVGLYVCPEKNYFRKLNLPTYLHTYLHSINVKSTIKNYGSKKGYNNTVQLQYFEVSQPLNYQVWKLQNCKYVEWPEKNLIFFLSG